MFGQVPTRRVGWLTIVVLIGAAAMTNAADKDDWKRLGMRRVEHRAEKDEIEVGVKEGTFKALKFEVHDADLEILRTTSSTPPAQTRSFRSDRASRRAGRPAPSTSREVT